MLNFTNEQLEAAKAAKSPEELVTMAKEAGQEITLEQAAKFLKQGELADEELENVAGGGCGITVRCPKCGGENISVTSRQVSEISWQNNCTCKDCGEKWTY